MFFHLRKKQFIVDIIFFISIFILYFFIRDIKINKTLEILICFGFISIIGISHGALDHIKGQHYLILKKFSYPNVFFYFFYITFIFLFFMCWILFPIISLIIFLIISSFHFGKEDIEILFDEKKEYFYLLYFLKGSLIILFPLYIFNNEINLIFNILTQTKDFLLLDKYLSQILLLCNLLIQLFLILFFLKKKLIKFISVLIIVFQVFSVFISFYLTNILIGFTLYFCISHSFKNIINIIYENNNNFKAGLLKFIKDAAPLTFITFSVLVLMIFLIINNEGLINATIKTIFIGIACLALPHIMLHFLIEGINEKKS